MEHVRSPVLPVRAVQRVLDPLAVRFEADHLVREPLDYLAEIGFEVETSSDQSLGSSSGSSPAGHRADPMNELGDGTDHEAIVCGAGPAGLATAAMLRKRGVESLVLEQGGEVAPSWRSRYDGLRLNTLGWMSRQPGLRPGW